MRVRAIVLSAIAAIGLVAGLVAIAHSASVTVQEAALNPSGSAFEINQDPAGNFWVSDYSAEEVWQIQPATGAYTVYENIVAPSDARGSGQGDLWWAEINDKRFGRIKQGASEMELWQLGGSGNLYGTTFDASGRFWVSDSLEPKLYGYSPNTQELCTYFLPGGGTPAYLASDGTAIWLGDGPSEDILRLNPNTNQFDRWPLPAGSRPSDVELDSSGDVWWSDIVGHRLWRLQPEIDVATVYTLPVDTVAAMIAPAGENIWYSNDGTQGAIGLLRSAMATGKDHSLSRLSTSTTPLCGTHAPDITASITISTGVLAWSSTSYNTTTPTTGILEYEIPGGYPWGITVSPSGTYAVDYWRNKLVHLPPLPASVTACKVEDLDGKLSTTGDQSPVEDWPFDLLIDGVAQGITQTTGLDGCTTWSELTSGINYGVAEELPEGWRALTGTEKSFGPAVSAGAYSHTFINTQKTGTFVYLPMVIK